MNLLNWIYLSIGFSFASLVWVSMLRRHLRNQRTIRDSAMEIERRQKQLDETRAALQKIYYRIYHKEIFPEICRVEGVLNLEIILMERAIDDSTMAQRPEHYSYNRLVLSHLNEMHDVAIKGRDEVTRLKARFQSIMSETEHLQ